MNRIVFVVLVACLGAPSLVIASPNWTKTGDCRSCHTVGQPGTLRVSGFYTRLDVDGTGRRKAFWVRPGGSVSLSAVVSGLELDDRYAVSVQGLMGTGLQSGAWLRYFESCDWAEWQSEPESRQFYTRPPFPGLSAEYARWPAGPTEFAYDLQLTATSAEDVFDVTTTVAGAPKVGTAFFATQEQFYLVVSNEPPPVIKSADFDSDGDVDLDDFAYLQAHFSEPNPTPGEVHWTDADLDDDGEVHLGDFAIFEQCFNGPYQVPKTACAP
jgi:hypothetical protein